jgi:hypothetical protein
MRVADKLDWKGLTGYGTESSGPTERHAMADDQTHCTQTTPCHFHILEKLTKALKFTLDNAVQWFRKQSNSLQIGQVNICIKGVPVQIPVTCILNVAVPSTASIFERGFIYMCRINRPVSIISCKLNASHVWSIITAITAKKRLITMYTTKRLLPTVHKIPYEISIMH